MKANIYEKSYLSDLKNRKGRANELQKNLTESDLRQFYTGGSANCYHLDAKLEENNRSLLRNELSSYYTSMLLQERILAKQQQGITFDKENTLSQTNSSRNTHRASQKLLVSDVTESVTNRRLLLAVLQNNIQLFRGMVKEVTAKDLQTVDRQNNTPLYYAVRNRNAEMVECLLKLGAQVEKRCNRGETALHLACRMNNLELINLLLRSAEPGATEIPCDEGRTPFMRITDRNILSRIQVTSQTTSRS